MTACSAHRGHVRALVVATLAACLAICPALGQEAARAPGSEPQSSTSAHGDWVVRCSTLRTAPGTRQCEAAQIIQRAGDPSAAFQIALGKPDKAGLSKLVVLVPPNIRIGTAIRLVDRSRPNGARDLSWATCLPIGCTAETRVSLDETSRWMSAATSLSLSYRDAAAREVSVVLSPRGLGEAIAELRR